MKGCIASPRPPGFGAAFERSNRAPNFRYTGREFDAETGLYYYYYYCARYFESRIGRFIGKDPTRF
jgi:RHS repeat-associated protein